MSSINDSIKRLESAVLDVSKSVASIMQNISGTKVPHRRLAGVKEAGSASGSSLTSSSVPTISGNISRSTLDSAKNSVRTNTPESQNSSQFQSTEELTTAISEYNLTPSASSLAVQSYAAIPARVRRLLVV